MTKNYQKMQKKKSIFPTCHIGIPP